MMAEQGGAPLESSGSRTVLLLRATQTAECSSYMLPGCASKIQTSGREMEIEAKSRKRENKVDCNRRSIGGLAEKFDLPIPPVVLGSRIYVYMSSFN